jgi:hypothetical protein
VRDLRRHVGEAALQGQVLGLAVHGVDEVADGAGATEVELALDLEDLVAGGRLGKVGFGDGEGFLAQGEEVVAGGVVNALARRGREGVGRDLEHVAAVERLDGEGVVGQGEDLLFHDERGRVFGDEGGEDGGRGGHRGELDGGHSLLCDVGHGGGLRLRIWDCSRGGMKEPAVKAMERKEMRKGEWEGVLIRCKEWAKRTQTVGRTETTGRGLRP